MTTHHGAEVIAIEEHYWNRTVAEHYNIGEQPKTTLDPNTERKLLMKALGVALELILQNHIFWVKITIYIIRVSR